MKELKEPWLHWHSVAQAIPRENFPRDHPIHGAAEDALFNGCESAHLLQTIIEPAVRRWTNARMKRVLNSPEIEDPTALIRQVLTATTVNIISARQRSRSSESQIEIPLTLFADTDTLLSFLPDMHLDIISSPRPLYEEALARLKISLRDTKQSFDRSDDAYFAWAVPERAFEDIVVVQTLVRVGILSEQFATALLMIDLSNPIDSSRRAGLMRHVPASPVAAKGPDGLQARILQSICASASEEEADELAIMGFMKVPESQWQAAAARRLANFFDAVRARAKTLEGVIEYLKLADWRRRSFRRNRKLAEFNLTLPFSKVADDAPGVELMEDGVVRELTAAAIQVCVAKKE